MSRAHASGSLRHRAGLPPLRPHAARRADDDLLTAETPLRTADFDYDLPAELIAQEPLADRAASRLLVVVRSDRRTGGSVERRTARRRGGRIPRRQELEFPPGEQQASGESLLVDSRFAQLPDLLSPGDLLVLNTTKVRHARLVGKRPSGAPAEVLLIHPAADESWIAMGKPGSALQPGKRIAVGPDVWIETLEVLDDGNR
ncbi:MAG: S-adenosylmethionine:tRNA ribosyltransferase-isomerase, partial [Gemmatimonadales bacterium]|nr:S-adenosylmethionine:tRNA ribosyltransferase-isomerase [Gemmatimonadales bacterium]